MDNYNPSHFASARKSRA